jgi:hypothetical protein
MSFSSFEVSVENSQPVELYRIELGTESFEYTTSEHSVTHATLTYLPEAIKRGKVGDGPEERGTIFEVEFPGDNDFVTRYVSVVPGQRALMTVRRLQRLDTPTPEAIVIFIGYVRSVSFVDQGHRAKVAAAPISAATSRPVPRFTYQGLCNHVLYDSGCKVSSTNATWKLSNGTVTTVDGNDVVVPEAAGFPDGWFTGGFLEAQGGQDARMVLNHVGDTLTILLPFPFSAVGQLVNVYAGCDHTIETCDTKFFTPEDTDSNVLNFGGFAFVPHRNIFSSGIQ